VNPFTIFTEAILSVERDMHLNEVEAICAYRIIQSAFTYCYAPKFFSGMRQISVAEKFFWNKISDASILASEMEMFLLHPTLSILSKRK
jgi:hypothetical protein